MTEMTDMYDDEEYESSDMVIHNPIDGQDYWDNVMGSVSSGAGAAVGMYLGGPQGAAIGGTLGEPVWDGIVALTTGYNDVLNSIVGANVFPILGNLGATWSDGTPVTQTPVTPQPITPQSATPSNTCNCTCICPCEKEDKEPEIPYVTRPPSPKEPVCSPYVPRPPSPKEPVCSEAPCDCNPVVPPACNCN